MTLILRLQGLAGKAGIEDIRSFFGSLHIPHGGVYIVGGSLGEAFIAFSTQADIQLAMRYNRKSLKGSKVTLHMSSMVELEEKLESLIKKTKNKVSPTNVTTKSPESCSNVNLQSLKRSPRDPNSANSSPSERPADPRTANLTQCLNLSTENPQTSVVDSLDSNTAFLLGICTVLQELHSSQQRENKETVPRVDLPNADSTIVTSDVRHDEVNPRLKPGYVRLFGLPASATKEDIINFFKGLAVEEAIVNVSLGHGYGCLVKFADAQDAHKALDFSQQSLGSCVEVRGATEKMWRGALQECGNALGEGKSTKPHQDPRSKTATHKQKDTSVLQIKSQSVNQMFHKPPKWSRLDCDPANSFSTTVEYTVMVRNLPQNMTKTEIKELFGCPNIAHKSVLHLLDKESNRTDTAFLIFNCVEDYEYAMNLNGCHLGSGTIEVTLITKKMMRDMMSKAHPQNPKCNLGVYKKTKPNLKRNISGNSKPERKLSISDVPVCQEFA
ncbi:RNA binding motif protein 12Ba [Echeneis naucrates]|uniref:RNA binding motif protein 12Ba n=1 Tax=Echeneis naucrates TaxID=173247 RepID=UPI001113EF17|nr:RNA-binding protein 12-like [Echeneis naucrates]XP_029360988.1 RNA-binding protein 12-like [Echeneis naucrates]XP_029360989.1 RNA-binding protein 12-like [Echeneis naucrates]XP_029360990.1 RNA-binding protein 12-like [Echeneis naucrates]XP_029360991.1 RNA-binding protein 12-like [Echeneis naucrates]